MSDSRLCVCGAAPVHALESAPCCCWCWVVERGNDPYEGHPECLTAKKRIAAIQTRFRSAVLAEREACAQIVEEVGRRQPLESMPIVLLREARKSPERVLRAILDNMIPAISSVIRSRVDPIPAARGK